VAATNEQYWRRQYETVDPHEDMSVVGLHEPEPDRPVELRRGRFRDRVSISFNLVLVPIALLVGVKPLKACLIVTQADEYIHGHDARLASRFAEGKVGHVDLGLRTLELVVRLGHGAPRSRFRSDADTWRGPPGLWQSTSLARAYSYRQGDCYQDVFERRRPAQQPHVRFGVPVDADPSDDYLIDRDAYVASYNRNRGVANWVAWRLTAEDLGTVDRTDAFRADDELPADFYRVIPRDWAPGSTAATCAPPPIAVGAPRPTQPRS